MKRFITIILFFSALNCFSADYWSAANNGLPCNLASDFISFGAYTFAALPTCGVRRTADNGANWSFANNGVLGNPRCLAASGAKLFVGSSSGLFFTLNNGDNWTAVPEFSGTFIYSIATSGDKIYVGTGTAGVYYSSNNGTDWTTINNGLTISTIYAILAYNDNVYVSSGHFGIFFSSNSGTTWTAANTGLPYLNVRKFGRIGSAVFAQVMLNDVYRTTNNGALWTSTSTGSSPNAFVTNGSILYAGTSVGGFKYTTDFGQTWTAQNSGLTLTNILCMGMSATHIYVGTNGNGIFVHELSAPVLTTNAITSITTSGANSGGNITDDFELTAFNRGICWNTSGTPTTSDTKANEYGTFSTGSFTSALTDLQASRQYYVRAYAANCDGVGYGNELVFTTIPTLGEWGLIAFGGLVAIIGCVVVWRRFV